MAGCGRSSNMSTMTWRAAGSRVVDRRQPELGASPDSRNTPAASPMAAEISCTVVESTVAGSRRALATALEKLASVWILASAGDMRACSPSSGPSGSAPKT